MGGIADNLRGVLAGLPEGVRLVAVSKFHPVEALLEAYGAGQRIFGENRAQELVAKSGLMPSDVEWHFIGHLQSNKVRQVAPVAALIHSCDSPELLRRVDSEARRAGRVADVLLELHVAVEATKSGMTPDECLRLADSGLLLGLPNVRVCGVMGMATLTDDTSRIRGEFRRIRATFEALKAGAMAGAAHFREVSMGMSDDYPIAVDEGSTMVRIGTSIFGPREY